MVSYVNFEVRFGAIVLFQGYVATCFLIGVVQIYLSLEYTYHVKIRCVMYLILFLKNQHTLMKHIFKDI